MSIIDMHAHAFPDKIALRAAQAISAFYGIGIHNDGTYGMMFERGRAAGISRFAVLSVATSPEQTVAINNSLAGMLAERPDELIAFGAAHPGSTGMADEVGRVRALGFKGMKIHPDIQGFPVDDPRMFPVYEAMGEDMILFTHAGDYRYDNSSPARVRGIRRAFPKLLMICAHFGGWSQWDEARELLCGEKLFVDTSSTTAWKTNEEIAALINAFGYEKVLFGTDYPMWNIRGEVERIESLRIPAHVKDAIFSKNAERLL